MSITAAFSPDYATARRRFREAASRLGWEQESHPVGLAGPNGEELTIDVALAPGKGTSKALVVSSGIHGVEGFFGSAVQLGLLEQWHKAPPAALPRCVFLHGLNPFGFAWLRRFDENNVDLNRNLLLPGEPFAGAPSGYVRLDGLLNPKRPPSRWEPFTLKAMWQIARHGMPALRQAVAGGQYEFPQGLFFGGSAPSRTNQLLTEHLPRWLGESRDVVHLDFHTGLGPSASCKLLIDYPLSKVQEARLTSWFGRDSFEASDSQGIAYSTRGSFGQWCVHHNPAHLYLYACAEFGTYGPIKVLAGLRAENQAHHWARPADASTLRAKQRLKELFCPASENWGRLVLERSFDLVARAVKGMTADGPLVEQ